MGTKEKISECKTMIDAAFQGINKMTVTGVTGCTTVSAIADCLVKAYKLAEEIETEVDYAGNKDDKGE